MEEFLAIAVAFPTVCFTAPLLVAAAYWVTVIVGVADVDLLGHGGALDAAAAKAEGVAEAVAGKLEAVAGKVEAAANAAADGVIDDGPFALILSALRLRRAPVTVTLSVLLLVGWIVTFFAVRYVAPVLPLPGLFAGLVCIAIGLLVAWPVAAAVTFPIGPVFAVRRGVRRADLVGRTVVVLSSRVDRDYGEGELADGGAGLLLQIRCPETNSLKRGDEALLVAWEDGREVYDVAPLAGLLDARADRG